MIIGFEGTPICYNQLTGIGIHEKELCKSMISNYPDDSYVFSYFADIFRGKQKHKIMQQYLSENVELKSFPLISAGLYRLIWGILPIPYRFFFGGKPEITHFFNFLLPPGVKGKKVVTVHDLAFVRYPETVAFKTRKALSLRLSKTLKKADHIFVASDFTARELDELYGVPAKKMTTVYAGVDKNVFRPMEFSECKDILEAKGLDDKSYFFYLGTIEPRKNIKRMIYAYLQTIKKLNAEGRGTIPLVIGGKLGWYYEEILKLIKSEGIEDKIILAGYLEDKEKVALYSRARAFVFPSLYEGFGIPVLEAMACATPVLTSNVSSLPEVVGDKAILCNPFDVNEIADGIYRLATDESLCGVLSREGFERSKMFSWDTSARVMHKVYENLVGGIKNQ